MSIQFDLFLHSADVVAENELREVLLAGTASQAQQKLAELRTRNPGHKALAPASVMIDALKAEPPHDSNTALERLNRLEQAWTPAAKTLFGVEGQGILAPLWRAAGMALESIRFDPEHPDHHASRAYLACGDWNAALRVIQAEQDCENQPVLSAGFDNPADLFQRHEHAGFIAGEALKTELSIPALAPREGFRIAIRHHVQQNGMAAGFIGNDTSLLENVVHEQTANSKPLRLLVNSNLTQEQDRNLPVAWCTSRRFGQFSYIHRADIDRMIAKDFRLPRLHGDIDPGHVVLLLFPRGQLQIIVQPSDATAKPGVIMSTRVPAFDIEGYVFSQHLPRGAGRKRRL